jgi:hypothetical protein
MLLLVSILSPTSVVVGYSFIDFRENNGQTFLGLGISQHMGAILCTNSIAFLPSMAMSGKMIQADFVEMHYQGSLTPHVVCFKNFQCELKFIDGTPYKNITSTDPNSIFMNITNVSTLMTYKGVCQVFDKLGNNATTEERFLSIIGTQGINNVTNIINNVTNIINISNITPGHTNTIDVLGVLALIIIILFIAAQFADMRILGVLASLLLVTMGAMVISDGIVYKVGTITGGEDTTSTGGYSNISGNTTFMNETAITYKNTTITDSYAKMSVPFVDFSQTIGLIFILIGMFGMLHYGLGVGKYLQTGK